MKLQRMGQLADKAKLLAAIELKNLEIAYLNGGIPGGYAEFQKVQREFIAFLNADITDEEILAAARGDMGRLDGILSKVVDGVKNAAQAVGKAVSNVVTNVIPKVAQTAVKIVTAPVRAVVGLSLTVVLKALKGVSSRAFLYVFIPDNSPYLSQNPTVKAKREKALKVRSILVDSAIFNTEYFNKLIRNNVIEYYKKTPEQLIKELSEGKEIKGLGDGGTGAAIIAALVPIAAALIAAKFGEKDIPAVGDWIKAIPKLINVTGEPLPQATTDKAVITMEDVQEKGTSVIPPSKTETQSAGKAALWLGVGTGAISLISQFK